ncbi:uncharacterized protein LOC124167639 [Ischnura elegans]|uniref:uncharacterized protein LOC124167639 n=1 Tax=Ischnura elegans TaxID=197161 RepID=UPI001ED8B90D|nr:uncharacterized protein LOC124167639 [Ischnura elegans]
MQHKIFKMERKMNQGMKSSFIRSNFLVLIVICTILCFHIHATNGARILGLFAAPAPSHNMMFQALMKALAERGHSVEVASPVSLPNPPKNYKDIVIPYPDFDKEEMLKAMVGPSHSPVMEIIGLWSLSKSFCEIQLASPELQKYLKDPSSFNFDVIFVEVFFFDCLLGFAHHFKAPVIAMVSQFSLPWAYDIVGNPHSYSHSPSIFLPYGENMTFFERLRNTLFILGTSLARRFIALPIQNDVAKQYFGHDMPPLWELERNVSLVFSNGHPSTSPIHATMPHLVEVAGMHILAKPPPLPKELQQLMDANSKVIIFSLGSIIESAAIPKDRLEALLIAFEKIDAQIIWKWDGEEDELPRRLPSNVHMFKWIPQQSLLAHPNMCGFVTHGGLLSLQEATYHGVPLMGFPFYGDQFMNLRHVTDTGMGLTLNFFTFKPEELIKSVNEILHNPRYKNIAKKLSSVFRDQPETPLQRGVYWTEYVIRHKGTHHLRSAAMDQNWFQYHLIDVAAFIIATIAIFVFIVYHSLKFILSFIFPKKELDRKKKKTKQSVNSLSTVKIFYIINLETRKNLIQNMNQPLSFRNSLLTVLSVSCLVLIFCEKSHAARILGLFVCPDTSHNIMFQALMKTLAERGHEVEVASPCPLPPPIPDKNYKDFMLPRIDSDRKGMMKKILSPQNTPLNSHLQLWSMANVLCDLYLSSDVLRKYLAYNTSDQGAPKFDLVIIEIFYYDCLLGFAHHFDTPMIGIVSQYALPWASDLVGNPDTYARVPHVFLQYGAKMTTLESLHNFIFTMAMNLYRRYVSLPQQTYIARKYFGPDMPPLWDIEQRRTSLIFSHGHPAITPVHPMMPNLIDVAGMHIMENPPPLPKEVNALLEEHEKVILFSLGSVISYDAFEEERMVVLLEAFKEIKCQILWKWDGDAKDLPLPIPNNVHAFKWIPQQSVLAHPNVLGMVTHGGLLSLQEAIYHGVPVIGFPFFGDQHVNMNRASDLGYGLTLNFYNFKKEELVKSVSEILNNPNYLKTAKKLSSVFRDQPETPLQRGVYWTEYIIRHKGAPHLKSTASDLNWFQYYLIDVVSFIIFTLGLSIILCFYLYQVIKYMMSGKPKKTKKE